MFEKFIIYVELLAIKVKVVFCTEKYGKVDIINVIEQLIYHGTKVICSKTTYE